ncbi:MAG: adenylosuccinate synthase [Candidatus Thorarchaeota archaeon]|nr:adenylosuccinate synthase [Candidatus Thorarchaeota archaeon]
MSSLVVVGLQWGDEGKGKVVDFLSESSDIVVRFQGGSNAGHTVVVEGKAHKFRVMPTGMLRGKKGVIGNGVVLDPAVLIQEIEMLRQTGVEPDLLISDRVHLVTPFQIQVDALEEEARGSAGIGTTKRGIGPTYSDKVSRYGVRLCDMLGESSRDRWDVLRRFSLLKTRQLSGGRETQNAEDSYYDYHEKVQLLSRYVGDSGEFLHSAIVAGKRVLFEGAQGTLLDIDHGTYPFVTSSSCVAASASSGTGVGPDLIGDVMGVYKAYVTRVGSGPFPTELLDATGQLIRERGGEFGTVTGRPRRCGWLDLVALKYAVRVNGAKHLCMTKADVLGGLSPIRVCVAYEIDGSECSSFPSSPERLSRAVPVLQDFRGWTLEGSRVIREIPAGLREYVGFIDSFVGRPTTLLSYGPQREQTIDLNPS